MRTKLNYRRLSLGSLVTIIVLAGTVFVHAEAAVPGGVSAQGVTNEAGLSTEYILNKVHASGYTNVINIELEHDLYNIKVQDTQGQYVEIYIDPKTGELIKDKKTGKPRYKRVSKTIVAQSSVLWEDIVTQVKAEGYVEVYSIIYEHAMYEVQARDAQNRKFELYVNPNTGKLLRDPKTGKPLSERLDKAAGKAPQ